MRVYVEIITPDRARSLLSHTPYARQLSRSRVEMYASDMRAGRWRTTGETVRLTENGVLLNGHHRMHAVVQAGVPIQTVVVYGVDPTTNIVADAGLPKRHPDWSERRNAKRGFSILTAFCRVFATGFAKPTTAFLNVLWDAFGDSAIQAGSSDALASISMGVALVARQDRDRARLMSDRLAQIVTVPAGSPEQAWTRARNSPTFKRYTSAEQGILGARTALGVIRGEEIQVLRPVLPATTAQELKILDLVYMIETERGRHKPGEEEKRS